MKTWSRRKPACWWVLIVLVALVLVLAPTDHDSLLTNATRNAEASVTIVRPHASPSPSPSNDVSLTASPSVIIICPPNTSVIANCSSDRQIALSAKLAGAAEDEPKLLFTWTVSAGRLSGEGPKVTWDLRDVSEGTYIAAVEVNAGNQPTATAETKVTIRVCSTCDPPPPPCPIVSVSCPTSIDPKGHVTFDANVAGGDPKMTPAYTWKVSAGKIVSGQGTSKIMVDVSDLNHQSITATVTLDGADPACPTPTASCTPNDLK